MKNDLDFDLSDIKTMNETQTGLLNSLDDILITLLDPLDNDRWPDDSKRSMAVYGLIRNQQAIKALLLCLKSTTKDQTDKLEAAYQKYVEGAE